MKGDNNPKAFTRIRVNDNILSKAIQAYKREGLSYVTNAGIEKAWNLAKNYCTLGYYRTFKSTETFEFRGKSYNYLFHIYSTSWKNERAVVIPIVWDVVRAYQEQNKNILEVGNVLSYVYEINHDILDKYEIMDGVINEDVVSFNPTKQYDLIVSIFTLQLVGWNEKPREPNKFFYAVENLKSILAPGGQMIIVHPLGENPEMDKALKKHTLPFDEQYYLKKISGHRWQEVKWEEVKDVEYDTSIQSANGVVIAVFRK